MLSSAPMFIAPCYFGTDIPSKGELFACNHDPEEMQRLIGADSLGFLSVEGLQKIAPDCSRGFCAGCFAENYPIPMEDSREDWPQSKCQKPQNKRFGHIETRFMR